MRASFERDVAIVGGCGRVGLPLGLAFADRGLRVALYDLDEAAVAQVCAGVVPFLEPGAPEVLARVLGDTLIASTDPAVVRTAETIVIVIGTPVDPGLTPDPAGVPRVLNQLSDHLVDGQLLVLRSTVSPGVTAAVARQIEGLGRTVDVAFCPERLAPGQAMVELHTLPQIVSGVSERAAARAEELFRKLVDEIVHLSPEEAELAKLFTNFWRYIRFAAANQLFIVANDLGLDYDRIRTALAQGYARAADLPRAGFAAGPCLFKDTAQLGAANPNFVLGHASMVVNEGLPQYLITRLDRRFDLARTTVGILGMAFKADVDDIRSSLSYKLRKLLEFRAREILCTDPYVTSDPTLLPLPEVLDRADVMVIGAPHRLYASVQTQKPVVDIWNLRGGGSTV